MTAIAALVTGVLTQIPVSRTTKAGTTMATGSLAVEVGDGKLTYLGLLAFGSEAEALLQCTKGDAVSVRGRMELNRWTSKEGETKERWQVIADSLLPGPEKPKARTTSRTAKSTTQAAHRFQRSPETPPFDDEVAF